MNTKIRFLSISFFLLIYSTVHAQFSGPNAVAWNPGSGKYYITNYTGKNVVSIDGNNNKSTFITGLTAPNNILYADLPALSGFLVLDSNYAKAYDDAGNFVASYTTTGAIKFQDAVYDTANQAIYISDVDRGVIYQTTFGGPPFYIPTTVIFATPHRRPSAMLFQPLKNRILYVEDTLGGNLMAVDLNNGKTSLVKTLNLDNMIGLDEDGQGNIYISSQGAKAIYQLNKYLSGSPKKLVSEPKPGDLYVNASKDQWVYTCIICGTVFVAPLHLFGPGQEVLGCKGDSFVSYRHFMHKNVGTFEQGNQFILEMSNSNFNFSNPLQLASIKDTLIPDSFNAVLPKIPAGNYKIRWRSTKPVSIGTNELVTIHPDPKFSISVSDTVQGCLNSVLVLGELNPAEYKYQWMPANEVDSPTYASVKHQVTKSVKLFLKAVSDDGCTGLDSAVIVPVNNPSPGNFTDSIWICKGSFGILGTKPAGGLSYSWSPGKFLNDSTVAQPLYSDTVNRTFTLTVTATGGCNSSKSQTAVIQPLPSFRLTWDSIVLCPGKTALNSIIHSQTKYKTTWIDPKNDSTYGDSKGFGFVLSSFGKTRVILTELEYGCSSEKMVYSGLFPLIHVKLVYKDYVLTPSLPLTKTQWFRNDTIVLKDSFSLPVTITGKYKVCGLDSNGCNVCSGEAVYQTNYVVTNETLPCNVYPNPVNEILQLNCWPGLTSNWCLYDIYGRVVLSGNESEANVSQMKPGMYFLKIGKHKVIPIVKSTP